MQTLPIVTEHSAIGTRYKRSSEPNGRIEPNITLETDTAATGSDHGIQEYVPDILAGPTFKDLSPDEEEIEPDEQRLIR